MRRNADDLVRRHIWVSADDWAWFEETFEGKLGISEAIRLVMRKYRQGIEAKVGSVAVRPKADLTAGE
jgi:hypothetical protein